MQQRSATVAIALTSFLASPFANAYGAAAAVRSQAAATQAPAAPAQESSNELFVTVGKSVIVNSALPIERVSVGFGEVAEATAVSVHEVLVNGKAPGETSLIVWQQGGGKLFFDVTVRPSRFLANNKVDAVRREIGKELPGQNINLSFENEMVFLRGTVKDLTSADRAVAIASTMGKVVNLLYVNTPPPESQILLKVKFASVDRSLSNQLGINIFSTGATNTIGTITTGQYAPPSISKGGGGSSGGVTGGNGVTVTLSNALNLFFFRPDLDLGATIQALQVKGILQVLAEPNVLAENGKQASFLAGGEFPFPVVQGLGGTTTGAVTIQFKQFGVRLNFIPTMLPNGTIHLQVAPEVSALDFTNGLVYQGFNVPAVTVRRVNTEVDLNEGQSFAIGGLLDNRTMQTLYKIPFIGDVPILGKLFQSVNHTKQNTELIVIVTPEVVKPIPAGHPVPQLNYPLPFLPPNTGTEMRTPGQNITGSVPVTPPNQTMPVEKLIESLQPEKSLVIENSSSSGASTSGTQSVGTPSPVGAAPPNPATPLK
jgi:pilus assembly protein CpaC